MLLAHNNRGWSRAPGKCVRNLGSRCQFTHTSDKLQQLPGMASDCRLVPPLAEPQLAGCSPQQAFSSDGKTPQPMKGTCPLEAGASSGSRLPSLPTISILKHLHPVYSQNRHLIFFFFLLKGPDSWNCNSLRKPWLNYFQQATANVCRQIIDFTHMFTKTEPSVISICFLST